LGRVPVFKMPHSTSIGSTFKPFLRALAYQIVVFVAALLFTDQFMP